MEMNFGIWNIQGWTGKTADIIDGIKKLKLEIAVLTETKRKGTGIETVGDYVHIYTGVPKHLRASKGVSILISKKLKKKISNWEAISERLIIVNLTIKGHKTTVVGGYAPNEDALLEEKEKFQRETEDVLSRIGNQRQILMMGDFNGRTGNKKNDDVVGSNGEETLNDNGKRLIETCRAFKLKILNGFFKHKDIHKYTWHQATRQLRSIIDYVIIKQESKWKVIDVRVYRGIECGSDHYILKAKIAIKNKYSGPNDEASREATRTTEIKYNIKNLQEDSTRYLYQRRLDEKLEAVDMKNSTMEIYRTTIAAIHDAAKEALGVYETSGRMRNDSLTWSKALDEKKQIKQKAYELWLTTKKDTDREKYREEQASYKRMIKKNKDETWEKKCSDIDNYLGGSRSSEAWKLIRTLRADNSHKTLLPIISMETWKDHYQHEMAEHRPEFVVQSPSTYRIQGPSIKINRDMISKAIRTMKNGRASGPEGIPAELLKSGSNKLKDTIATLFEKFINGDQIPEEWKMAWITPLHKKGRKDKCENYRCISVTSSLSRLYGKVIRTIIEQEYAPFEIEQQAGFRAGRTCVDNIFSLNQLTEKKVATNREVHLLFIDLTKAYDNIPIKKLWQVLERTSINITAIQAIKQLYSNCQSRIKIGQEISESFHTTKGLRQGCCLSPTLFKIYIDAALKHWRRSCQGMGIEIDDETTLFTLHFADDQVVIAQDPEDLEYMTRKLIEEYNNWGLTVNMSKTKYLKVGGEKQDLKLENNIVIEACDQYTYLGTRMDSTGRTENEVGERIAKGKRLIGAMNSILWSKNVSRHRKQQIYNVIFKSVVLYGSETWQLNKALERRLNALEMDFWRRSAGISRLDRISNERVRAKMKIERTLVEDIQERQLRWYGHVQRMQQHRIPKQVLQWTPTERRKKGRPKITWTTGITRAMSERNLRPGDWNDRREWRLGTGRRRVTL